MQRKLLAALTLALFAGTLAGPGTVAAAEGPSPFGFAEGKAPREILSITTASSGVAFPLEAFDAYKIGFYDINGDGRLEIITHNDNNRVYVFDSATGKVLTELTTGTPERWAYRETSGIAIGDLRGNGRTALVVGNTIGILTAFEFNPEKSTPDRFQFDRLWKRQLDPSLIPGFTPHGDGPAMDGAPGLGDANGDGKLEIYVESDNGHGQYAFDHEGNFLWGGNGEGNAYAIVTDLNSDGLLEVVYSTDGGEIMVYDARSGKRHFTFDSRGHGANPGSIPKAPAVLDLDGDGIKEIYFGTRYAVKNESSGEDWYKHQHTIIFGLEPRRDLSSVDITFKRQPAWAAPMVAMRPSAVDVNGDGRLDLIWFDWNTIGHKPGNWETTGAPNLFALDKDGNELWHVNTNTFFSSKDIAIADLTGDGVPEIIHVEGRGKHDGISYRDLGGRQIAWFPAGAGVVSQAPLLVDLDGDGLTELVTAVKEKSTHCERPRNAGCNVGAIKVFATGMPWRAVYEDGLVWFNEELDRMTIAGEKGPVPRGNLTLEATAAKQGKLSVQVESNAPIDRVRAKVGGTWVDLTRQGDAWVGDVDVPQEPFKVAAWSGDRFASVLVDPSSDGSGPGGNGGGGQNESPNENRVPVPGLAYLVAAAATAALLRRRRRAV